MDDAVCVFKMPIPLKLRQYTGPVDAAPTLVLLHGWGVHSGYWGGFVQQLQAYCHVYTVDLPGYGDNVQALDDYQLENLLDRLIAVMPEQAVYLGWSMGGILALGLAARYPDRVLAVVGIASNPCFVASEAWPCAMPKATYHAFEAGIRDNCPLTLKRFQSLQVKGCPDERALLLQLRRLDRQRQMAKEDVLMAGLGLLAQVEMHETLAQISQPVLWVLGANDAIVPLFVQQRMETSVSVQVVEQASHLPFLSHPEKTLQHLLHFFRQHQWLVDVDNHIEKQQIAASFSRAAPSYDSAAVLQRQVGQELLQCMPQINGLPHIESQQILDVGCGTGYFTRLLKERYSEATVTGVDLAQGMLEQARLKAKGVCWAVGDAEGLPIKTASISLVFSNLVFQWSEKPILVFQELARILKPGGYVVFSTLTTESLWELRAAWQQVDEYTHVNRFVSPQELEGDITESNLQLMSLEEKTISLSYAELKDLTAELRCLGARNLNQGRPRGLAGRQRIQKLKAAYERFRNDDGKLPASYAVIYCILRKMP